MWTEPEDEDIRRTLTADNVHVDIKPKDGKPKPVSFFFFWVVTTIYILLCMSA